MSKFFELWCNVDVKLSEFDAFYYKYSELIQTIEHNIGIRCADLKADTYTAVAEVIDTKLQQFISIYETNPYYKYLLAEKIDKYNNKKNVTNLKDCLKESYVYGALCAYRLFYVGCSRARKNLVVVIKQSDISSFENELRKKFSECGFDVE